MLPLEGMDWKVVTSAVVIVVVSVLMCTAPVKSMRLIPLTGRMASLPKGVVKYSQVPSGDKLFAKDTIPKGLLRRHNTKEGTWGIINVAQGRLRYTVDEGPHKGKYDLDADTRGVIEPRVYHSVAPVDDKDVSFVVEFYRFPGTGSVNEKRE
jgi:tellurite resistance-related uncharacterized protein